MRVLTQNISITKALLDHLKELFPNTLPCDPISIEQLRFLQGQQAVIAKLDELFEETFEDK